MVGSKTQLFTPESSRARASQKHPSVSLMPVKVIISAGAGPNDNNELSERLAAIFKENQIDVDMSVAESGAEVTELARDAARGAYKVIVAGGGDGKSNSEGKRVVDSGRLLGILQI